MLLLIGEALEIERKPFKSKPDSDGVIKEGVLTIAHIRDGKRFSRPCVVPDDFAPVPVEDEELCVEVRVFASQNVRGLDWQLIRRVDPAGITGAPTHAV